MMELLPSNLKIDFLAKAKYAYMLSLGLICMAVYLWVSLGDTKFGTDYRGGAELTVKISAPANVEEISAALEAGQVSDPFVQAFEFESSEYLVRVADSAGAVERITAALKAKYDSSFEILKTDVVGPTIGEELRRKAMWAMAASLIAILIYVSVRFEFAFAVGAVVAIFHDVIVALGIYLLCGHTITAGTLAAALTIVGYSVNDTIVIFDRVREELFKKENERASLGELVNRSVNLMLSRTIVTSLLTLFSAVALLVVGGGTLSDMSLFLVAGIIVGSYSTIYIAAPVAIAVENFRAARIAKQVQA